jgi:mannosyltransferase
LAELGVSKDRSSVIFAPAPRRNAPLKQASAAGLPAGHFTVLYVGQISHDKGVHLLVEAALEMCTASPDICFLIAGNYDWNNPFAEALIQRVRLAGMVDRINFTGFVEDIEPLYKAAHLHVCPSLCEEAYGLTVLEAKERGLQSIVFASGGLPELVTNGADGMVCVEKSASSLRRAIETYVSQPGLAKRHGLAALDSLNRLGIDQFAHKWRAVYDRVGQDQAGGAR